MYKWICAVQTQVVQRATEKKKKKEVGVYFHHIIDKETDD